MTVSRRDQIAEEALAGVDDITLMARYTVTRSTIATYVHRYRKANGLVTQKRAYALPTRRGEAAPNWVGGRVTDKNGYVLVLVNQDDDIAVAMAYNQRYIPEHRLVMAHSIGRPLTRREQVHHKNGKRDDNRLENLQLRSGPHGAGAAFRCGDCGSHNVEAVDI